MTKPTVLPGEKPVEPTSPVAEPVTSAAPPATPTAGDSQSEVERLRAENAEKDRLLAKQGDQLEKLGSQFDVLERTVQKLATKQAEAPAPDPVLSVDEATKLAAKEGKFVLSENGYIGPPAPDPAEVAKHQAALQSLGIRR